MPEGLYNHEQHVDQCTSKYERDGSGDNRKVAGSNISLQNIMSKSTESLRYREGRQYVYTDAHSDTTRDVAAPFVTRRQDLDDGARRRYDKPRNGKAQRSSR